MNTFPLKLGPLIGNLNHHETMIQPLAFLVRFMESSASLTKAVPPEVEETSVASSLASSTLVFSCGLFFGRYFQDHDFSFQKIPS